MDQIQAARGRRWMPLALAWGTSVLLVLAVALILQLGYAPPKDPARDLAVPEPAQPQSDAASPPAEERPSPGRSAQRTQPDSAGRAPAARSAGNTDLLFEPSPLGPLPRTAPDGRRPLDAFAAAIAVPRGPVVAIVLVNIGLSGERSRMAIAEAPPPVTLAISPYADAPQIWADRAREAGHEVLVMVPTEPQNYPDNDPGPHTLLVEAAGAKNVERLHYVLSRFQGYVGLVNHMGSRFTTSRDALRPVLQDLQGRGLLVLDSRASRFSAAGRMARELSIPAAINNRFIDQVASAPAIDDQLADLAALAKRNGAAVGIGEPYPVTLDRVKRWRNGLSEQGVTLVPISIVAGKQVIR